MHVIAKSNRLQQITKAFSMTVGAMDFYYNIISREPERALTIQRCYIENQMGTMTIDFVQR